MQLAEWYDAIFSKQQRSPDLQKCRSDREKVQSRAQQKQKHQKMVNHTRAVQVVLLLV